MGDMDHDKRGSRRLIKQRMAMLSTAAALTLATSAYAQQVPQPSEPDIQPPADQARQPPAANADVTSARDADIIVTGIRRSLQQAADIKRVAPQVLDVITADDVGKLPDQNVAEALQRVTGVQITRVFGEGQSVSVRGLQQVRIEVDGRTLLGYSARLSPPENEQLGRSSGLDSVPSSLFGRLEVRKSPLASQVEGGLGGSVNLVTPKPFDFKKTTVSLRAQGTYSEGADKFEPTITGLATTMFGDNVGVLLSGEYQKRTSLIQSLERNNFFNRRNGTTTTFQAPQLLQYENFLVDRSRKGVNGSVQIRVDPDFVVSAEGLYSELTTGRHQDFLSFRLPTSATAAIITNPTVVDNYIVAGTTTGTLTTAGQIRNEPTKNYLGALNGTYDNGTLKIVGDGYYSRGTIDQTIQIITLQAKTGVPGTFDFRGGTVPSLTLGTAAAPFDVTNINNFSPAASGVRSNRLIGVLEEWTGKVDVDYKIDDSITLSAGARYVNLQSRSNAYRSQVTPTIAEITPYIGLTNGGYLPDINAAIPRPFLTTAPTYDYVFKRAQAAQPDPANPGGLLPNPARDYDLTEKTYAGYAMISADGTLFGIDVTANAGVRYVKTDFSVDSLLQTNVGGVTAYLPVNDKANYGNFLPSVNTTFNVTSNFIVRIAASKTLQRAGIADLAPSIFVNTANNSASGGNAQLKPPTASNADISFEYYSGKSSLISGAVFYKRISNFIASNTTIGVFPGYETLGPIPYTRPDNVASAKVKGFEIGVQQFLDFLPSPLDGFGIIANYTFSDTKDSNGFPLVATSKNSYNLIGLYEKGPVSARVAYNYRDKAVFEFTEGRPSYIDARSQLDVQLGYDFNERFALQLLAQNLFPSDSATVEYSGSSALALNSYALSERRYSIGLRARF